MARPRWWKGRGRKVRSIRGSGRVSGAVFILRISLVVVLLHGRRRRIGRRGDGTRGLVAFGFFGAVLGRPRTGNRRSGWRLGRGHLRPRPRQRRSRLRGGLVRRASRASCRRSTHARTVALGTFDGVIGN